MTKWIEQREAAEKLGVPLTVLRKMLRSATNPPPYVRPTERTILFDVDALTRWQQETWKHCEKVA